MAKFWLPNLVLYQTDKMVSQPLIMGIPIHGKTVFVLKRGKVIIRKEYQHLNVALWHHMLTPFIWVNIGSDNNLTPVKCQAITSKTMLNYCKLDPKEQTAVKFELQYKTFHSRNCVCHLQNGSHFVLGSMCQEKFNTHCHNKLTNIKMTFQEYFFNDNVWNCGRISLS